WVASPQGAPAGPVVLSANSMAPADTNTRSVSPESIATFTSRVAGSKKQVPAKAGAVVPNVQAASTISPAVSRRTGMELLGQGDADTPRPYAADRAGRVPRR